MKLFEHRTFESWQDRDSAKVLEDAEFRGCKFVFSSITASRDPRKRQTVRNVRIVDCFTDACHIGGAVIEDVMVDGLRCGRVARITASVFKHVELTGRIDEIQIHPSIFPGPAKPSEQAAFDEANRRYYESVDWALDIRRAEFVDAEILGVPARLVRRDPATQVVITREKALVRSWRHLDLSRTPWAGMIQFLLDDGYADKILIAPKRHPDFAALRAGLQRLREAGVAEPD